MDRVADLIAAAIKASDNDEKMLARVNGEVVALTSEFQTLKYTFDKDADAFKYVRFS